MDQDDEYISNYFPRRLYVSPGDKGTYVSIADDSIADEPNTGVIEISISPRTRLAVKMFHVAEHGDWNRLKITKLQFHKTHGWRNDGSVVLNQFSGAQLTEFLQILSTLDLSNPTATKIDLGSVQVGQLATLLQTNKGRDLIQNLADSPHLEHDIIAIGAKRRALERFEELLANRETSESNWQNFFETNPWVFGHGLASISFGPVGEKLESTTTGANFNRSGKRADALLKTRAAVSQCALVEIKKSTTPLLQTKPYRSGCWGVSHELSDAVTQTQKTAFDFGREHFRVVTKDSEGGDVGNPLYAIEPRTYLVAGSQDELVGNDDKIACFELYRRNIRSPEILTFDELHERAKFILSRLQDD